MKNALQLLLLIFLSGKTFSQDGTSTKITIFQPEGATPVDGKPVLQDKNVIKWNYSVMTRGVFLMNYEFFLTDKLTAEAGLGLTYRDYIFELIKYESMIEYTHAKANFCAEGALRLYPKGHHNFEGIYLSPVISYRKYSFDNQLELYSRYPGFNSSFLPGYNFLDLQVKFGYQYESFWSWDIVTDFYIGFAYRNVAVKYYQTTVDTNYNTIITPTTRNESYPHPILGFKLGFPF